MSPTTIVILAHYGALFAAIAGAFALALREREGWGWLVFLAILLSLNGFKVTLS